MSNPNANGPKHKWILQTVLFMSALLTIFGVIHHYPRWGIILAVFTIVAVFVACYLRAKNMYFLNRNNEKDNNTDNKTFDVQIEPNELKSAQRLLRYSTAILAFLSLITTSQGMQSFVFGTGWMAYLGSFAVQGILVVFSLLLCHLLVTISYLGWPEHIRKAASTGLILFFCVALVVSSSFSYSYISNYAYKDSWANDREAMISHELLTTAYALNEENNERMKYAFSNVIKASEEDLEDTVRKSQEFKASELKSALKNKANSMPVVRIDEEEINQVKLDLNHFLPNQKSAEKNSLYDTYQISYATPYQKNVQLYNDIVAMIDKWKSSSADDILKDKETFRNNVSMISVAIDQQKGLEDTIKEWNLSWDRNALNGIRINYINASNHLRSLLSKLNELSNGFIEHLDEHDRITSSTTTTDINQILKDILR